MSDTADPTSRKQGGGDPESPTDEELLLRFRDAGDLAAFETLVHRYERELYGYLHRYVGDAALADDLFQATFLQVYEKADQFRQGRRVRPWLYSIATHLAIDWHRKAGRQPTVSLEGKPESETGRERGSLLDLLASPSPGPELEAETRERREWIRRAVDRLPEDIRVTAILVFFQGLKYSEVAKVLDIPIGTVKSRIHSALVRLHSAWREENRTTQ